YPGGPWWGAPNWGASAPAPRQRRRYVRPLLAAAVVAGTVAASVGIGHAVWASPSSSRASATSPNTTNPFFGSGGSNNPFFGDGGNGSQGSGNNGSNGSSGSSNSGGPADASSIAARVDPAVVDINIVFDGQVQGAGTGIVLTSNGEVLTNNHVVEGATSISVTDIGNGKTYGATVVGYDRTDDVAVIQLKHASGLQTAKIGDSSSLAVGDGVVGIGNAGGVGGTPSAAGGSITGLNQAITASDDLSGTNEQLTGLIETNANIQEGDSGGPLVNSSGKVIGMDTAAAQGFSLSSQANQGYAIPIAKALSIVSQIEAGHSSSTVHVGPTAFLGVQVSSSGGSADPFSQNGGSFTSGAAISGVVSGGPAQRAGLTQGDVITSLGGQTVSSPSDLTNAIAGHKPGDRVQVGWTDSSGASHTATVTLASGPAQ
ncbi:MAG: trypsin-like peptidase domain-containing protein, partial [Acidimicrobiaceae bacterium]|nr:trypsin-like peptidase domain-containing protein [Acidimicrobiaceae bacterium]